MLWLLERALATRRVHPCRRTITPPYAGKHSAQPSQVSPVRCTERLCRHANHWKCPVVMVSIPLARRHGMCGRVASTRSRSGSEAPEPGPPRLCAGRNRRRRRSATPGMARGERYVSVDRQSKGGVTVSYSGYKRQRGERRRRQVRAKLREIRRNARHSIGRMDRGRSATIGCGETAPAQTAFSCAGLSGRPALRQISAAARVRGLRGNFRPDFNGVKNCSANMRIGRQPRVLQTGAASGVPTRFS